MTPFMFWTAVWAAFFSEGHKDSIENTAESIKPALTLVKSDRRAA